MAIDTVHVVDPVEPVSKLDGMIWINPEEIVNGMATTKVWDADNAEWVQIAGQGEPGPQGPIGATGPAGADGASGATSVTVHEDKWDVHWKPLFFTNDEDNPNSPGVSPNWAEITGVRLNTIMPEEWVNGFALVHGTYENEFSGRTLQLRIKDPEGSYSPIASIPTGESKAFGRTYIDWQNTSTTNFGEGFWALEARSPDGVGAGNFAKLTCALFRLS